MIAGIDYSLNSPCVCVWKNGTINPSNCTFSFFALDKWRDRWSSLQNVNCFKYPQDLKELDRYKFLAEWVIECIRWFDGRVKHVYLEDYAYAATGRVFHIAENMGILKYELKSKGFNYTTVPPTVIKKFATQKGNASKDLMLESFQKEKSTLNLIQDSGNPASDIIDSYFICKYGYEHGNTSS